MTMPPDSAKMFFALGGIAQLGERLNGIQEVSGSIPLISTMGTLSIIFYSLSLKSGYFLCCNMDNIQTHAELLKVNVKVDVQLVVPVDLHPLDKTVDDHFLGFDACGIVHISP